MKGKVLALVLTVAMVLSILPIGMAATNQVVTMDSPSPSPSPNPNGLCGFTTTDLYGNEVTGSILQQYNVTMIPCWADWCGYCIEEMPALQDLYEAYSALNVNILGLYSDGTVADGIELAEGQGVTYTNILPDALLNSLILDRISAYPTIFFVDNTGSIVEGYTIVGSQSYANLEGRLRRVLRYLGYNDELAPTATPDPTPTPTPTPTPPPVASQGYVNLTLAVNEARTDATGYQVLLDSTALLYGTVIPEETLNLVPAGDDPTSVYSQFDYKLPENADGLPGTQNMLLEGRITVQIPIGRYDFCVANPRSIEGVLIPAGSYAKKNNFNFVAGYNYELVVTVTNDGETTTDSVAMRLSVAQTAAPATPTPTQMPTPTPIPTQDPTPTASPSLLLGDANNDGTLNTGDAACVLRYLVNLIDESEVNMLAADANQDTNVNTGDAALILEMCLEM